MDSISYREENLKLYKEEDILKNEVCKAKPIIITIQDTNRCNLRCFMCQRNAQRQEIKNNIYCKVSEWRFIRRVLGKMGYAITDTVMDINLFRKIANETFPFLRYLYLTVSGEVFTNPNFSQELDIIEEYGTKLVLFSNATLIPKGRLLSRLVKNLSELIVSFDAATKTTYEKIRKGAKYEKVIDNIRRFNESRKGPGIGNKPKLTFRFVLMRNNIEELTKWVELVKEFEADNIAVAHVIIFNKLDEEESLLHHKQIADYHLERARKRAEELKINIQEFPFLYSENIRIEEKDMLTNEPCAFLWREAFIELDGSVYPCCGSIKDGLLMGNIKYHTFDEIWNGTNYQVLRRSFKMGNMLPQCKTCYHRARFTHSDNKEAYILCR